MSSGGKSIQIGPFKGGLNTHSDNSAIDDSEMVVCDNFELDFDGSLVSRPPIEDLNITFPLPDTSSGVSGDLHLLGYYTAPGNTQYLLASDGISKTYYFDGATWIIITSTFAATDFAQFNTRAWMTAPVGSVNPGGYWSPLTGFVADASMPQGDTIVALKSRLWIAQGKQSTANNTFVYFSNVLGSTPFWKAVPDFIDVGSGDGQNIVKLVVYYGSILIFRDNSIYIYTFAADPATGIIQLLVPGIGLTDKNCVVAYQNYLYFLHNERVYEFLNNRANQINQKVPLSFGNQTGIYLPYAVSLFNQRIMVSYWDKVYVFNLLTRTWTTWSSTYGALGRFIAIPPADGPEQAILQISTTAAGNTGRKAKTYRITHAITNVAEPMLCTVHTKIYNYQASATQKRLFSAGIDGIFRGTLTARAIPIFYTKQLTWGQVAKGFTWGQLAQKTWGTLSTDRLVVEAVVDSGGSSSQRKFQKLFGGLFFRQIAFEAVFTTDGSVNTAPVRLFSFMTYVLAKENVTDATS